ncbi:UNVERIFIED_CONTAM: DUF58 domain-containing protein [Prevotella sp. 15_C9]
MFLSRRFYILLVALTPIIGLGYVFPSLFVVGKWLLCCLVFAVAMDIVLLYHKKAIKAVRHCSDRFSNGDSNPVDLEVKSSYPFKIRVAVIDEAPVVFQRRDVQYHFDVPAYSEEKLTYRLRPVRRGVYDFGNMHIFVRTMLGLLERRYTANVSKEVKVYPSFLMLNRYELAAMSENLMEMGIKRIRRVGNATEFEQIKDYVKGDDYRTINWKSTARCRTLMVNVYQDERSQQVYSVIDKGRVMQQAFNGMTLLDYSINASLVLSYVAIHREDKAGLITFSDDLDTSLAPSRRPGQMQHILDALYNQRTNFSETDFSNLCVNVNKQISKRSLLVLYTNFSGMSALQRQLSYLKMLSRRHRLLVVFFEDSELNDFINSDKRTTEDYYQHVIAEKFAYEKRLIVTKLHQHGILSLLTRPETLSIDVINKYLELKQRQMLT